MKDINLETSSGVFDGRVRLYFFRDANALVAGCSRTHLLLSTSHLSSSAAVAMSGKGYGGGKGGYKGGGKGGGGKAGAHGNVTGRHGPTP